MVMLLIRETELPEALICYQSPVLAIWVIISLVISALIFFDSAVCIELLSDITVGVIEVVVAMLPECW